MTIGLRNSSPGMIQGARSVAAPLKENVYRVIRSRLVNGQLPPGSQVSELLLSKELGVSRGPIREAIHQLVGEGFVDQIPNARSFVKTPNRIDLEDLYQLREWLEGEAAAEAARRIDEAQSTALDRLCSQMRAIADEHRRSGARFASGSLLQRHVTTDLSFHMTLIRASGNRRAIKIIGDHHVISRVWISVPVNQDLHLLARSYRGHVRIAQAVRRGDPEAAQQYMKAHIRQIRAEALAAYDQRQRQFAATTQVEQLWPETLGQVLRTMEETRNTNGDKKTVVNSVVQGLP